MTNTIILDIDTERKDTILFGKPPHVPQPQTKEEAKEMVLNDIACLSQAIASLILIAAQNTYGDKKELVHASVKTIYSILETESNNAEPK